MLRTIIIFLLAGAIVGLAVYSWNANKSSLADQDQSAASWDQIQSPQLKEYSKSLAGATDDSSTLNLTTSSQNMSNSSMSLQDKLATPQPTQAVID